MLCASDCAVAPSRSTIAVGWSDITGAWEWGSAYEVGVGAVFVS